MEEEEIKKENGRKVRKLNINVINVERNSRVFLSKVKH
jgi:hypothetical protein